MSSFEIRVYDKVDRAEFWVSYEGHTRGEALKQARREYSGRRYEVK
jgi:hypothetical protein